MKKNEVAYYPEITQYIEAQMKSNFLAKGMNDIDIFWKSGELTTKLKEIVSENPTKYSSLNTYCKSMYPLNLDIFGVVTNGDKFEIIILEIKLVPAVGLSEWSQLIGYSIVANSHYGLLINIDNGASSRLSALLSTSKDVSCIIRNKSNGEILEHKLGFMQWNSLTRNFEYSNMGQLWSISRLCDELAKCF